MRDDTGVVEPLPVGLDTRNGCFAALVRGGLCDVALGVALGLAVGEALEDLYLFGAAVKILTLDFDL